MGSLSRKNSAKTNKILYLSRPTEDSLGGVELGACLDSSKNLSRKGRLGRAEVVIEAEGHGDTVVTLVTIDVLCRKE